MLDRTTFRHALYQPLDGERFGVSPTVVESMVAGLALIDLVSGIAMGEQGDKAIYDIVSKWNELRRGSVFRQWCYFIRKRCPYVLPL